MNMRRDRDTDESLRRHGWAVVRVWEHEDAGEAASKIEALVRTRRPDP